MQGYYKYYINSVDGILIDMQIYLPIAEVSANFIIILSIGFLMGFFAGIFGVGGGFIGIPLLIFIGINPAVAVASTTAQMVSTGFSNFLIRLRRGHVDFRIGYLCLLGGIFGAFTGTKIFAWLYKLGTIDIVISLSYVLILGTVGLLMAAESIKAISRKRKGSASAAIKKPHILSRLPFWITLSRSEDQVGPILPILLGLTVGILVAITGIGSGFLTIPVMIYLFRMPTLLAIGTSVFQATFVIATATVLQALNTHTVDIFLTFILMVTAVLGVQTGARLGSKIPPEELRAALSCIMLLVVVKLLFELFVPPDNIYSVARIV
ncbi:UPF0721 transmembrane protein [Rickettsiales bacterium]|nr:UPF0721 transmembrane protein [Rickettsiales bacterium]